MAWLLLGEEGLPESVLQVRWLEHHHTLRVGQLVQRSRGKGLRSGCGHQWPGTHKMKWLLRGRESRGQGRSLPRVVVRPLRVALHQLLLERLFLGHLEVEQMLQLLLLQLQLELVGLVLCTGLHLGNWESVQLHQAPRAARKLRCREWAEPLLQGHLGVVHQVSCRRGRSLEKVIGFPGNEGLLNRLDWQWVHFSP